jgi:hypothetical protein
VKFCRDLQTEKVGQQPTCTPRTESEVLQGSSNQRGATTNLYARIESGEVLRGSSNPRGGKPAEKQEAMNGTGDMARNPRIKGDVTPNKKKEARNEERHYR